MPFVHQAGVMIADGVPMRIYPGNSLEIGVSRCSSADQSPCGRFRQAWENFNVTSRPALSSDHSLPESRCMLHERIESLDDPRLAVYRNLKTLNTARDHKLFIAEGPTVVERVLRSRFEVRSVLISDHKFASFQERLPHDVPVYRLRADLADTLVGFHFHCGVMACVVRKRAPSVESWLPATGPALILAGDRIVDPENVGALIRIASAFGCVGVVFGKGSADAFSRRVLRVSMGNVLFLPVVETEDLPTYLKTLTADYGCQVCPTVLDANATPLSEFRFPERTVLLMGNEYDGVSAGARADAFRPLTIPMLNGTDSLNVAVSSGIFLHHYRSQYPL